MIRGETNMASSQHLSAQTCRRRRRDVDEAVQLVVRQRSQDRLTARRQVRRQPLPGAIPDTDVAKARADSDGLRSAIELVAMRGAVDPMAIPALWVGFHVRRAATLAREGQRSLAFEQVSAARAVSFDRVAAEGVRRE
jgi:hypothetical protein